MAKSQRRQQVFRGLRNVCPSALTGNGCVQYLSDFFAVINWFLRDGRQAWFRGHADASWTLVPGALRYRSSQKRALAIALLDDFRRCVEPKIGALKSGTEDEIRLHWLQLAQHYGMPTRMLDWTTNAAVGLYFACADTARDGAFFILDPINLNTTAGQATRVLNAVRDMDSIRPYLVLGAEKEASGIPTIAIQPTWNNERVTLQHGCFTLHGSQHFALDVVQAPGLSHIPIHREHKARLRQELSRIGIGEMFIFPEPEHVCNHLKCAHGLA